MQEVSVMASMGKSGSEIRKDAKDHFGIAW